MTPLAGRSLATGLVLGLAGPAFALEVDGALNGDVKTFAVATIPYEHFLMPSEPSGQGFWDLRLKGRLEVGPHLRFQAHHAVTTILGSAGGTVSFTGTGVGLTAPEAIDLSWTAFDDAAGLQLAGRTDRLTAQASVEGASLTVGRQAVAFGNGLFFTPLDLIGVFSPATIDTEYKPGVDAVRLDGFFGTSGTVSLVSAYVGDWTPDGMIHAAYGQGTVGVTDLGGFLGMIHGEPVFGVSTASGIGPVGVHADATLTLPEDDAAFVRAVAGGTWLPLPDTTVSAEAYVQTFGAEDPEEYLVVALSDRFTRGEVWSLGRWYTAVAVGQQITPLISANLGTVVNLADPSALLTPGLNWNLANNARLGVGAFVGLGERPDEVDPLDLIDPTTLQPLPEDEAARLLGLNSEFGLYPAAVFLNMAAYF